MTPLQKAAQIAADVRKWAENRPWNWICKSTLWGMCAIASSRLFSLLKKERIPVKLIGNNTHVFTMVNDWIVDVTATQFGYSDEVFISKLNEDLENENFYKKHRTFSSITELINWQKRNGWSSNQSVTLEKIMED